MKDEQLEYVIWVFDSILENNSRNTKEEYLQKLKVNGPRIEAIAKELFSIALDWYRHYGIATFPELEVHRCKETVWTIENFFQYVQQLEAKATAISAVDVLHAFPYKVAFWLRRCLLKDLKFGVQETTVNKVWPGLIRTFSCALADTCLDLSTLKFPVLGEPKIDGIRAVAVIKKEDPKVGINYKVEFCSRSGKELCNLDEIKKDIVLQLVDNNRPLLEHGVVLDGELFSTDFHHTQGLVRSSKTKPAKTELDKLKYYAFDILSFLEWEGTPTTPQIQRKDILNHSLVESKLVVPVRATAIGSYAQCTSFTARMLEEGYEGSMLKDPSLPYQKDRSSAWLKYKPVEKENFVVIGFHEGEGRHSGRLGAFEVQVSSSITCKVGGGLTDAQRDEFWATRDQILGRAIKVEFKWKTPDGRLREPVFLALADSEVAV